MLSAQGAFADQWDLMSKLREMEERLKVITPFVVALNRPSAHPADLLVAHANVVDAGVVICPGIVDTAVDRSVDRTAAQSQWRTS